MSSKASKDGGASRRDFLIRGATVVAAAAVPSAVGPSALARTTTSPSAAQQRTTAQQRRGVWDAADCALLMVDYQESVLGMVFEQDRRVVGLNASLLANVALSFKIPVVLSTVAVQMGINKPTIASLQAALPGVKAIDRSSMDPWEDPTCVAAVKATGRKRLVIGALMTSVCLKQRDREGAWIHPRASSPMASVA